MQGSLKHTATTRFWECYRRLPPPIRELADVKFRLLRTDPRHPSLHFKQIDTFWSCRIGSRYRALGLAVPDGIVWFWIGTHADYDALLR